MFGQPRRGTNLPLSPLPCCRFNRDTHRGRQARAASRRTFNIRDVESTSQDSNRRVLCTEWVVTVGNSQSDLRAHQAVHAWQTTPDTVCPRAYTGIGCANSLGGPFGLDVTAYRTRPLPTGGRRVGSNKVVAVTGVPAMVPKRGPHLTLSLATRQRGVS